MKNDLSCAVVRDLLPSYAEGLTEEETSQAVAAHMNHCPDCTARYRAMTSPDGEVSTKNEREVDYLKTVRKKNRKKIICSVLAALLVALVLVWAKIFLIGTPAEGNYSNAIYNEEKNTLSLQMCNPNSGRTLIHITSDTVDGVMTITGQEVPVSFIHNDPDSIDMEIPLDGLRQVVVFGQPVWQDGVVIHPLANLLFEAKVPYVGNPSSFSGTDGVNGILTRYHFLPPYSHTHALQTAQEPYGWKLVYEDGPYGWGNEQMEKAGMVALALIGNMGEFSWAWPDSAQSHSLTLEKANAALPGLVDAYNQVHNTNWMALKSVKDYAKSPRTIQQLINVLDLRPMY